MIIAKETHTQTNTPLCVLVRNYYLFNWGCAVSTTDTQRYRVGPGPGPGPDVAQGQQEKGATACQSMSFLAHVDHTQRGYAKKECEGKRTARL